MIDKKIICKILYVSAIIIYAKLRGVVHEGGHCIAGILMSKRQTFVVSLKMKSKQKELKLRSNRIIILGGRKNARVDYEDINRYTDNQIKVMAVAAVLVEAIFGFIMNMICFALCLLFHISYKCIFRGFIISQAIYSGPLIFFLIMCIIRKKKKVTTRGDINWDDINAFLHPQEFREYYYQEKIFDKFSENKE